MNEGDIWFSTVNELVWCFVKSTVNNGAVLSETRRDWRRTMILFKKVLITSGASSLDLRKCVTSALNLELVWVDEMLFCFFLAHMKDKDVPYDI
nr:hypothetical protein [Tanacetum cinerariifolium]